MQNIKLEDDNIDSHQVKETLKVWLKEIAPPPKKVLLLPPDFTRCHSKAGLIVSQLYELLFPEVWVDIMPALGTHAPMSRDEMVKMFGPSIPGERFIVHDWRNDIIKIGEIPSSYISEVSGGLVNYPIDVEINKKLLDESYDLIISIGQVVPHEVVGMANYNKNIFVGCGGKDIINKSHFLGAAYGMEKMMGRDYTPVRKAFDYAEEEFLQDLPLQYILTVTTTRDKRTSLNGLYVGRDRKLFEEAVALSQNKNLDLLENPLSKVVVYLDPEEFKSTWLGNKAIYRTRMAIADGGDLLIIGPGIKQFGEDSDIDKLIRKYGYTGAGHILQMTEENKELGDNLSAAAHLIHGSSEGRFNITYATRYLAREEVEGVNYNYMPMDKAVNKYDPSVLNDGFNTTGDGEEIFFVSNPALGLWALRSDFEDK